jgi:hypothetical protein
MPLKAIENPQVYSSIDKVILENQGLYTVDDALKTSRITTDVDFKWKSR